MGKSRNGAALHKDNNILGQTEMLQSAFTGGHVFQAIILHQYSDILTSYDGILTTGHFQE